MSHKARQKQPRRFEGVHFTFVPCIDSLTQSQIKYFSNIIRNEGGIVTEKICSKTRCIILPHATPVEIPDEIRRKYRAILPSSIKPSSETLSRIGLTAANHEVLKKCVFYTSIFLVDKTGREDVKHEHASLKWLLRGIGQPNPHYPQMLALAEQLKHANEAPNSSPPVPAPDFGNTPILTQTTRRSAVSSRYPHELDAEPTSVSSQQNKSSSFVTYLPCYISPSQSSLSHSQHGDITTSSSQRQHYQQQQQQLASSQQEYQPTLSERYISFHASQASLTVDYDDDQEFGTQRYGPLSQSQISGFSAPSSLNFASLNHDAAFASSSTHSSLNHTSQQHYSALASSSLGNIPQPMPSSLRPPSLGSPSPAPFSSHTSSVSSTFLPSSPVANSLLPPSYLRPASPRIPSTQPCTRIPSARASSDGPSCGSVSSACSSSITAFPSSMSPDRAYSFLSPSLKSSYLSSAASGPHSFATPYSNAHVRVKTEGHVRGRKADSAGRRNKDVVARDGMCGGKSNSEANSDGDFDVNADSIEDMIIGAYTTTYNSNRCHPSDSIKSINDTQNTSSYPSSACPSFSSPLSPQLSSNSSHLSSYPSQLSSSASRLSSPSATLQSTSSSSRVRQATSSSTTLTSSSVPVSSISSSSASTCTISYSPPLSVPLSISIPSQQHSFSQEYFHHSQEHFQHSPPPLSPSVSPHGSPHLPPHSRSPLVRKNITSSAATTSTSTASLAATPPIPTTSTTLALLGPSTSHRTLHGDQDTDSRRDGDGIEAGDVSDQVDDGGGISRTGGDHGGDAGAIAGVDVEEEDRSGCERGLSLQRARAYSPSISSATCFLSFSTASSSSTFLSHNTGAQGRVVAEVDLTDDVDTESPQLSSQLTTHLTAHSTTKITKYPSKTTTTTFSSPSLASVGSRSRVSLRRNNAILLTATDNMPTPSVSTLKSSSSSFSSSSSSSSSTILPSSTSIPSNTFAFAVPHARNPQRTKSTAPQSRFPISEKVNSGLAHSRDSARSFTSLSRLPCTTSPSACSSSPAASNSSSYSSSLDILSSLVDASSFIASSSSLGTLSSPSACFATSSSSSLTSSSALSVTTTTTPTTITTTTPTTTDTLTTSSSTTTFSAPVTTTTLPPASVATASALMRAWLICPVTSPFCSPLQPPHPALYDPERYQPRGAKMPRVTTYWRSTLACQVGARTANTNISTTNVNTAINTTNATHASHTPAGTRASTTTIPHASQIHVSTMPINPTNNTTNIMFNTSTTTSATTMSDVIVTASKTESENCYHVFNDRGRHPAVGNDDDNHDDDDDNYENDKDDVDDDMACLTQQVFDDVEDDIFAGIPMGNASTYTGNDGACANHCSDSIRGMCGTGDVDGYNNDDVVVIEKGDEGITHPTTHTSASSSSYFSSSSSSCSSLFSSSLNPSHGGSSTLPSHNTSTNVLCSNSSLTSAASVLSFTSSITASVRASFAANGMTGEGKDIIHSSVDTKYTYSEFLDMQEESGKSTNYETEFSHPDRHSRVIEAFTNHNAHLTDILEALQHGYEAGLISTKDNNQWRAKGMKRAVGILKKYPKIETIAQLERCRATKRGIGASIVDICREILETGTCLRLLAMKDSDFLTSIKELQQIHGVGPQVSQHWYGRGLRTVNDVRICSGMSDMRVDGILEDPEDIDLTAPDMKTIATNSLSTSLPNAVMTDVTANSTGVRIMTPDFLQHTSLKHTPVKHENSNRDNDGGDSGRCNHGSNDDSTNNDSAVPTKNSSSGTHSRDGGDCGECRHHDGGGDRSDRINDANNGGNLHSSDRNIHRETRRNLSRKHKTRPYTDEDGNSRNGKMPFSRGCRCGSVPCILPSCALHMVSDRVIDDAHSHSSLYTRCHDVVLTHNSPSYTCKTDTNRECKVEYKEALLSQQTTECGLRPNYTLLHEEDAQSYVPNSTSTRSASSSAPASTSVITLTRDGCLVYKNTLISLAQTPIIDTQVKFALNYDEYDVTVLQCYCYWHVHHGFRCQSTEKLLLRYLERLYLWNARKNTIILKPLFPSGKLESGTSQVSSTPIKRSGAFISPGFTSTTSLATTSTSLSSSSSLPALSQLSSSPTQGSAPPSSAHLAAPVSLQLQDCQRVGLLFHKDHQERMPRAEVAAIVAYVYYCAQIICPGVMVLCCGSFRRGKSTSGDCDVLISHPSWKDDAEAEIKRSQVLRQLLWALQVYNTPNCPSLEDIGAAACTDKNGEKRLQEFCRAVNIDTSTVEDDIGLRSEELQDWWLRNDVDIGGSNGTATGVGSSNGLKSCMDDINSHISLKTYSCHCSSNDSTCAANVNNSMCSTTSSSYYNHHHQSSPLNLETPTLQGTSYIPCVPPKLPSKSSYTREMPHPPTFEMPHPPTFEMPHPPTFEMPHPPTFEMPHPPTFEMPHPPTFEMPHPPTFEMPHPPTFPLPITASPPQWPLASQVVTHTKIHELPVAVPFLTGALRGYFPHPRAPISRNNASSRKSSDGKNPFNTGVASASLDASSFEHPYPPNILADIDLSKQAFAKKYEVDKGQKYGKSKEEKHDTTWMGFCRLPPWHPQASGKVRRIDIKLFPATHLPFAMLYFTGSDHFNRSMRFYAKRMGYSLSESSLCPAERKNGVKVSVGKGFYCTSEADVFETMGLDYVEPWYRNVYDIL